MAVRKIEFLTFNKKENPELIAKLNAVAPYEYLSVHTLAQRIMLSYLDKKIAEWGITVDSNQPVGAG